MQHNSAKQFCTTQWSLILTAKDASAQSNAAAMEALCAAYWAPLYSFARRKGNSPEDAQDAVQSFFARFLEKDFLESVEESKGKFRTFLLCAFTNFMKDEWDKKTSLKRGGGVALLPLDIDAAEEQYNIGPKNISPDRIFDKFWAQVVVDRVFERLRSEFATNGEVKRFEALQSSLMGDLDGPGYAELGMSLGLSEGGVKTLVRRMRFRFAGLLREEIASTLKDPADAEEEMRHLLEALAAR